MTPSDLKKCPDCAEQVLADARKCRFCGFIFLESPEAQLTPKLPNATRAQSPAPSPKRKTNPAIWILVAITALILLFLVAEGVIAPIMVPRLNRTAMYSQESGALAAIRTIHTAQVQYYSQFGKYATSLTELGPPISGAPGPAAADLIDAALASGYKNGYQFTLTGDKSGYVINANPSVFGQTGSRTFFSDQTMVIRQNYAPEAATANSPELR